MSRIRSVLLALAILALVAATGCSGSSSDVSGSGGGSGQPTGAVRTRFTLLPRAVPANITQFRFLFFDGNGQVVSGPTLVAKAATVTLVGIPTTAASMRIEYLEGLLLRGLGTVPLTVTAGVTTEVVDPPFQDVGSQVRAVEVTPVEVNLPAGLTRQFIAVALFFDGTSQDVTSSALWTSSDEAVATVGNVPGVHGLVTAHAAGVATITADYGGLQGSGTVTGTAATLQGIHLTPPQAVLPKGATQPFTVRGTFSDGSSVDMTTQVAWTSSDGTIVTVSADGVATAEAQGAATVTATHVPSGFADSAPVTVTAAALQHLYVLPSKDTLPVGVTQQYQALGVYSDNSSHDITSVVRWSTSHPTLAEISNAPGMKGLARGRSVGSTSVNAEMEGTGIVGTAPLEITAAVLESIEVFPPTPVIGDGQDLQFTAIGTYSDSSTEDLTDQVAWGSENPAVASVSNAPGSQGLAHGLSVGQAGITATEPDTGLQGRATLTVGAAVLQSITVAPFTNVPVGVQVQYTATGSYSDGSSRDLTSLAVWSSTDDVVASISNAEGSKGLATAHSVGATAIAATVDGITGATGLGVTAAVLQSIQVTPVDPSIPVGMQRRFTAVGTYSDASQQDLTAEVTWTSSDVTRVTVSNASGFEGTATAHALGQAAVTASMPGTAISGTSTVTVTAAVLQALTVTPADQTVPGAHFVVYAATGSFSDGSTLDLTSAVTWRSSKGLVAIISNMPLAKGVAISVLPGTTTISARLPNSTVTGSTLLHVQ